MLSVCLSVFAVSLIASGNMPLLGGKRARGNVIRLGGGFLLILSITAFFSDTFLSIIINSFSSCILLAIYFFAKGDNPTKDEIKINNFNSRREELQTYGDAAKGLVAFVVVISLVLGAVCGILRIIVN